MWRRNDEAAQRFADRRQREDSAPRLSAAVPHLESLRLEVQESRSGIANSEAAHIRHIVVRSPSPVVCPATTRSARRRATTHPSSFTAALARETLRGEDPCPRYWGSQLSRAAALRGFRRFIRRSGCVLARLRRQADGSSPHALTVVGADRLSPLRKASTSPLRLRPGPLEGDVAAVSRGRSVSLPPA